MPQEIEIYIDKIVLDGFDRMNARELKWAIQEHLAAQITEYGLPAGFSGQSEYSKLNGGQINMDANQKMGQTANGIAGGIYQGLKNVASSTNKI